MVLSLHDGYTLMHRHLPKNLLLLGALICGSHALDLQEQWVESSRWGALAVEYSPLTNPAWLTNADFLSVRAAMSTVINDFYVHDIGVTIPIARHQSAGVTWYRLQTYLDPAEVGNVPASETAVDKSGLLMFSYAVNPLGRLSLGLNLNAARRDPFREKPKTGFGVDIGMSYELLHHPRLGHHTLAVCGQNLIAPNLGSRQVLVDNLRGSWLWSALEGKVESMLDVSYLSPLGAGRFADRVYWPATDTAEDRWTLNERMSVEVFQQLKFHGLLGVGPRGFRYGGLAVELRLPTIVSGKDRDVALAYQHLWLSTSRIDNMSVLVRAELGKHRFSAEIMLQKALVLYGEHRWWEAFLAFGRIIAEYPNWLSNDRVSYYMARCEEELQLHATAAARYAKIREQYPASQIIPLAELGLLNTSYRLGDLPAVEEQFRRVENSQLPDSAVYHAAYIVGQTRIKQGEYRRACDVLSRLPIHHPDFVFSRHSRAVAFINLGERDSAIAELRKCIRYEPDTRAEEQLADRSRLMLGYLYYEHAAAVENGLAKAATNLRKIPRESYYFEDALLGLGWTALKADEQEDCLVAAKALGRQRRPILRAEGLLLQAYVFYLQRDYARTVEVLETALEEIEKVSSSQADATVEDGSGLEQLRSRYDSLGRKAERLAMRRRRRSVRRRLNEATLKQRDLRRRVEAAVRKLQEQSRAERFARRRTQLENDIQYALASATYMLHTKQAGALPKQTPKQRRIDRKIERLKKEMEELEEGE